VPGRVIRVYSVYSVCRKKKKYCGCVQHLCETVIRFVYSENSYVKYVYKFFMLLERLRYRVYISCNITNIIAVRYEELINLDHKIIKATLCGIESRRLCSDCKQPHTTHYIVNLSITLTQHIHPPSHSHLSLHECQLVLFLHWSCFTAK